MTDHKFTDEEVIKAFKCCSNADRITECGACPYYRKGCLDKVHADAADLINRQKAEIWALEETLLGRMSESAAFAIKESEAKGKAMVHSLKSEAVKEFAERLKAGLIEGGIYPVLVKNQIEKVVKDMTGEAYTMDCFESLRHLSASERDIYLMGDWKKDGND